MDEWTDLDQAELDLLAWELVTAVATHRHRCLVCAAGFPPCGRVRDACEAVTEWRRKRVFASRVEWLRAAL